MGCTSYYCPKCEQLAKIRYETMDRRDFKNSPFRIKGFRVYCKKCRCEAVSAFEYFSKTLDEEDQMIKSVH